MRSATEIRDRERHLHNSDYLRDQLADRHKPTEGTRHLNTVDGSFDVSTKEGLMAFYDEAFDSVYRCAARLTRGNPAAAEDLVQDAFVRLTRSARSGAVHTVGVGWMITTVRRLCIDRGRSADREGHRLRLVAASDPQSNQWAPTSDAATANDLLEGLSDRERTALLLRYVEDLPVSDVADLMGDSVRATESLLQRAKAKVRAGRNRA